MPLAEPNSSTFRTPSQSPKVSIIKVLTINTHKGFTTFNRRFILPELRDAVRTLSTDIVFLQEVIGNHHRHAKRLNDWPETPQYEYLADSMWSDFSYGRNAVYPHGDHGNALLSRFPILSYQNLNVSIGRIEQRGLLHSILDVPGQKPVHTICVHLGLRESHRKRQIALLGDLLDRIPKEAAVIVAGDFNDWRKRADGYLAGRNMTEAFVAEYGSPAKSFPANWPILCLDRIYVRNATTKKATVLTHEPWAHLSDHAPLAVEVHL